MHTQVLEKIHEIEYTGKTFEEELHKIFEVQQLKRELKDIKKNIKDITGRIGELNESLFSIKNDKEEALESLRKMKDLFLHISSLIAEIKESDYLYSQLSKEINDFEIEASQLNEIIRDLQFKFVDSPKDKELQQIMNKINAQFE